jgi:RNA recognition motif-containing protein
MASACDYNAFNEYGLSRLTSSSYNVTPEDLFELFGKFGPVRYVAYKTRPD